MLSVQAEDTLYVQGIGLRPKAQVSADGSGVVAFVSGNMSFPQVRAELSGPHSGRLFMARGPCKV